MMRGAGNRCESGGSGAERSRASRGRSRAWPSARARRGRRISSCPPRRPEGRRSQHRRPQGRGCPGAVRSAGAREPAPNALIALPISGSSCGTTVALSAPNLGACGQYWSADSFQILQLEVALVCGPAWVTRGQLRCRACDRATSGARRHSDPRVLRSPVQSHACEGCRMVERGAAGQSLLEETIVLLDRLFDKAACRAPWGLEASRTARKRAQVLRHVYFGSPRVPASLGASGHAAHLGLVAGQRCPPALALAPSCAPLHVHPRPKRVDRWVSASRLYGGGPMRERHAAWSERPPAEEVVAACWLTTASARARSQPGDWSRCQLNELR